MFFLWLLSVDMFVPGLLGADMFLLWLLGVDMFLLSLLVVRLLNSPTEVGAGRSGDAIHFVVDPQEVVQLLRLRRVMKACFQGT